MLALGACQPLNPVRVLDGDTLRTGQGDVRLQGMDAPEYSQFCSEGDRLIDCGVQARKHLEKLIDGERIDCNFKTASDRYGRQVGLCGTVMVRDLGRQMVLDGWAVSYYDYHEEERAARAHRRGMWRWEFERPADWRRARNGGR